jgi:hypothetical protein
MARVLVVASRNEVPGCAGWAECLLLRLIHPEITSVWADSGCAGQLVTWMSNSRGDAFSGCESERQRSRAGVSIQKECG